MIKMSQFWQLLLQKIAMPIVFGSATFFLPTLLMMLYLVLFFVSPHIPLATRASFIRVQRFSKLLLALSFFITVIPLIVYLAVPLTAEHTFQNMLFRHIGCVDYFTLPMFEMAMWGLPFLVPFIKSILYFMFVTSVLDTGRFGSEIYMDFSEANVYKLTKEECVRCDYVLTFMSVITVILSGILVPSVLSAVYLIVISIVFLFWSFGSTFISTVYMSTWFLIGYMPFHIFISLAYQLPWPQELILPNGFYQRLFGFVQLCYAPSKDQDIRNIIWKDDNTVYEILCIPCWMFTYQIISTMFEFHRMFTKLEKHEVLTYNKRAETDEDRLKDFVKKFRTILIKNKTISGWAQFKIYIQDILFDIYRTMYKTTFISSIFVMIIWSVLFPSYLTYVFFIITFFLLPMPKLRKSVLRASAFIVFYALILLVINYIWAFNLTESELPSRSIGFTSHPITLNDIGFVKRPKGKLIVFVGMISMIGILMTSLRAFSLERLYAKEQKSGKNKKYERRSIYNDTSKLDSSPQIHLVYKLSETFKKNGGWCWMIITIVVLFLVSQTPFENMNIMQIIYMIFILIPIISLEISWVLFRKILRIYLICVIVLTILFAHCVYIYQIINTSDVVIFDMEFSWYLLREIGIYKLTRTHFLNMSLACAIIVLFTATELHLFYRSVINLMSYDEKLYQNTRQEKILQKRFKRKRKHKEHTLQVHRQEKLTLWQLTKELISETLHFLSLHAEIHLVKVAQLAAITFCLTEINLMYFFAIILIVALCVMRARGQYFILLFISIIRVGKMIYKLRSVKVAPYLVCDNDSPFSKVKYSTLNWIGFGDVDESDSISHVMFIVYIIIVIINTTNIMYRTYARIMRGESATRPYLLFNDASRWRAEKSVKHCIKYFLTYGFYRFGIEVTAIATMAVIILRMDFFSLFYCPWVFIMILSSRPNVMKLWKYLKYMTVALILIQYAMRLGIPPVSCIIYPWSGSDNYIKFFNLPDPQYRNLAFNTLADFIVLMFCVQQEVAFRIELKYDSSVFRNFKGGSNKSFGEYDNDSVSFRNPTKHFILPNEALQIIKSFCYVFLFWGSQFLLCLTAYHSQTIYGFGYFICLSTPLWLGANYIRRPMARIAIRWQLKLTYLMSVVTIKALTQIVGCLTTQLFNESNYKWIWLLLNIKCIDCSLRNTCDLKNNSSEPEIGKFDQALLLELLTFGFMVFQLRFFRSYFYRHMVNYIKADVVLDLRGTMIQAALAKKQYEEQQFNNELKLKSAYQNFDNFKTSTHYSTTAPVYDLTNELGNLHKMFCKKNNLRELNHYYADVLNIDKYKNYMYMRSFWSVVTDYFALEHPPEIMTINANYDGSTTPSDDSDSKICRLCKREELSLEDVHEVVTQTDDRSNPIVYRMFIGILVSLTKWLYKYSRKSRYINRYVQTEKVKIMENPNFPLGNRENPTFTWYPLKPHPLNALNREVNLPKVRHLMMDFAAIDHNIVMEFIKSLVYLITANGDLVCFTLGIYLCIREANLLYMMTAIMILIWGSLCVPFAQSPFWTILLTYNTVLVVIKAMASFQCFPWNLDKSYTMHPLAFPRLLGLEAKEGYQILNVAFLFFMYMHRYHLRRISMWIPLPIASKHLEGLYYVRNTNNTRIKLPEKDDQGDSPANAIPAQKDGDYSRSLESEILEEIRIDDSLSIFPSDTASDDPEAPALFAASANVTHNLSVIEIQSISSESDSQQSKLIQHIASRNLLNASVIETKLDGDIVTVITQNNMSLRFVKAANRRYRPTAEDMLVKVSKLSEEPSNYFPQIILLTFLKNISPICEFYEHLEAPNTRPPHDYYTISFLAMFIGYCWMILSFESFGLSINQPNTSFISYLRENRVPTAFIIMVFWFFACLLIERIFYILKSLRRKIIWHIIMSIAIVVFAFIIVPYVTNRSTETSINVHIFFMCYSIFFLFQSKQLVSGYPNFSFGHFFMKMHNYFGLWAVWIYQKIPFLYELRQVLDWMCSQTTLTLMDWFKIEDIHLSLYNKEMDNVRDRDFPQKLGSNLTKKYKLTTGGCLFLGILILVWSPFLIFIYLNTFGIPNPPESLKITVSFNTYKPLFENSASQSSIYQFTERDYNVLKQQFQNNRPAMQLLRLYSAEDVTAIKIRTATTAFVRMPGFALQMMAEDLSGEEDGTINTIQVFYSIFGHSRLDDPVEPWIITKQYQTTKKLFKRFLDGDDEILRECTEPGMLPGLGIQFLKVSSKGELMIIPELTEFYSDELQKYTQKDNQAGICYKRNTYGTSKAFSFKFFYWCNEYTKIIGGKLPYADPTCEDFIVIYAFNDKLFPWYFDYVISAGGIISLYMVIIVYLKTTVRSRFDYRVSDIRYYEFNDAQCILKLYNDLTLARQSKEFLLEITLKELIFYLYRDPEALIECTQSIDSDDDDDVAQNRRSDGVRRSMRRKKRGFLETDLIDMHKQ